MITILENALAQNAGLVYIILFILIFFENIIPFIPGDAVLAFAAYLSGRTLLLPAPAFLITVGGSLTGFIFIALLSRSQKTNFDKGWLSRFSNNQLTRYRSIFRRHENWSLVFCRFVPGTRLVFAAITGLMNIAITKAAALTLLGILLWNLVVFRTGMLLGENWDRVKTFLNQYSTAANIMVGCIIVLLITWHYYQLKIRRSRS